MNYRIISVREVRQYLNESISDYHRWKRKNVTLRGIKELGKPNNGGAYLGQGLYSVPLSNKSMARQYGDVYFLVNAIPKKPKVVSSLNIAEIFLYEVKKNFCEQHNQEYSTSFFNQHTDIRTEMLKLGYDGLIVKGREMVNYAPEDVRYFQTEKQLIEYYESFVENKNE